MSRRSRGADLAGRGWRIGWPPYGGARHMPEFPRERWRWTRDRHDRSSGHVCSHLTRRRRGASARAGWTGVVVGFGGDPSARRVAALELSGLRCGINRTRCWADHRCCRLCGRWRLRFRTCRSCPSGCARVRRWASGAADIRVAVRRRSRRRSRAGRRVVVTGGSSAREPVRRPSRSLARCRGYPARRKVPAFAARQPWAARSSIWRRVSRPSRALFRDWGRLADAPLLIGRAGLDLSERDNGPVAADPAEVP